MAADYSRMPEEGEGLRAATDHGRVREAVEVQGGQGSQ